MKTKETDERFMHRMMCPDRGYSGSCLSNSGCYKSGVHILRACAEDIECPRMVEYDKQWQDENDRTD